MGFFGLIFCVGGVQLWLAYWFCVEWVFVCFCSRFVLPVIIGVLVYFLN